MTERIIELYAPSALERMRRQKKALGIFLLAFAAMALAACILLCVKTNTRNIHVTMRWTILTSIVAGWIVIYFYVFGYRQKKREIAHGENVNHGERETLRGRVEITKQWVRIRDSITVRKVIVHMGSRERTVNLNSTRVRQLQKAGENLILYVSHGYVTAYEVDHESH